MLAYSIFFVFILTCANGINWHLSQVILKQLYDLQNEQFKVTSEYLELELTRIQEVQSALLPKFNWYINNMAVKDAFIIGHTNGLKLMNRIHSDVQKINDLTNNKQSLEVLKTFDENKAVVESNIISAYQAIRRLQKVYAISAMDMAAGRYKKMIIGDPLDICNCYLMVVYNFKDGDFYGVIDWAVLTYNKSINEGQAHCVDMDHLEYYIVWSSMYTGFDYASLLHSTDSKYTEKFKRHISLMTQNMLTQDISSLSDIFSVYDDFEYFQRDKKFRFLCRQGHSMRTITKKSKCRYQTKNSPYRLLMPFKEEDISDNPYVKMYYDVIYDEEIKTVTGMAAEDLSDARYYINGKIILQENKRLGQLKWLNQDKNKTFFDKLNKRIECLTEFSSKTSEGYQAVNYGMSGHFTVHVDAFIDMTDVYDNGYTIFPNLNYVAPCQKGSALVWQNLYLSNGSVHSGTFHGGCPVLKGNKWIMTMGLYEAGQNLTYEWWNNKQRVIV